MYFSIKLFGITYMELLTAVNSIFWIDVPTQEAIRQVVKRRTLPKGAVLLNEGDIANKIHFVEEGLVRGFHYKDKREVTSWFANEGTFLWPFSDYLLQSPSHENIQLMEPTTLSSINRRDVDELLQTHIVFNELRFHVMEQYIIRYDRRVQMLLLSAEERLEAYRQAFPELYQRIPLRHIATYLGINAATLSRLRSNHK